MKVYRRSLFKTNSLIPLVAFLAVLVVLLPLFVKHFNAALNNAVSLVYLINLSILMFLLYALVFTFVLVYNNFYIIVSDSEITIVNGIIPFIKKRFSWNQIMKCAIGNAGGLSYNYFKVTYCNGKTTSPFVIDMVPVNEYEVLLEDIKSRGIEIEIVGHLKK